LETIFADEEQNKSANECADPTESNRIDFRQGIFDDSKIQAPAYNNKQHRAEEISKGFRNTHHFQHTIKHELFEGDQVIIG
jgi:hypothetical protein